MTCNENKILAFLPVMIELENMGHDPVKVMFGDDDLSIDIIGDCYVALTRAKSKHPEWFKTVGSHISNIMN